MVFDSVFQWFLVVWVCFTWFSGARKLFSTFCEDSQGDLYSLGSKMLVVVQVQWKISFRAQQPLYANDFNNYNHLAYSVIYA